MKYEKIGCLTIIAVAAINITVGTWSVIEILSWFGKSIPLIGSIIIGCIGSAVTVPVAIIGYLLQLFGVF